MGPDAAHVEQVGRWMRSRCPGFVVQASDLVKRDAILFRARKEREVATPLEIEISYEAFEDYPVEQIVSDLEARRAIEHLTLRPEVRLIFDHMRTLRETNRHSRSRGSTPATRVHARRRA